MGRTWPKHKKEGENGDFFFRLCLSLGVFAKMVAFVAFSKGVLAEIVV
jgi:hypothetical protein